MAPPQGAGQKSSRAGRKNRGQAAQCARSDDITPAEKARRQAQRRRDKARNGIPSNLLPQLPGIGRGPRTVSHDWTLKHDEPTRTDKVYRYSSVSLRSHAMQGASLLQPDPNTGVNDYGDNVLDWDKLLYIFNPGYHEYSSAIVGTHWGPNILAKKLKEIDLAAEAPPDYTNGWTMRPPADPNVYGVNQSVTTGGHLRARAVDAHVVIKIKGGASMYGTFLVAKLGANTRGMTVAEARAALLGDFHHVKRYDVKGGTTTVVLPCGVVNREAYGDFHVGSTSIFDTQGTEPLSGYIVAFQALAWASTDPYPTVELTSVEVIQTELALSNNHLADNVKQVPAHKGASVLSDTSVQKTKHAPENSHPKELLDSMHRARAKDIVGIK